MVQPVVTFFTITLGNFSISLGEFSNPSTAFCHYQFAIVAK
jgi:hypothetical protein